LLVFLDFFMREDQFFNRFLKIKLERTCGGCVVSKQESISFIIGKNMREKSFKLCLIRLTLIFLIRDQASRWWSLIFLNLQPEEKIRSATRLISNIQREIRVSSPYCFILIERCDHIALIPLLDYNPLLPLFLRIAHAIFTLIFIECIILQVFFRLFFYLKIFIKILLLIVALEISRHTIFILDLILASISLSKKSFFSLHSLVISFEICLICEEICESLDQCTLARFMWANYSHTEPQRLAQIDYGIGERDFLWELIE
jgi:hypothetical protein